MALRAPSPIRCDEADTGTPVLRFDRATLRKGRRLDDGAWVREAVLARADVAMRYPHGEEVATEQALSSSAYLESLRGLALVAKHPSAKRVDIARPDTYREVGTILGARWDSVDRCVIIEVVIRDAAANRAVEAGQDGVSEGYAVPHLDASTQPARQLARVPNHVALTLDDPPRMPGAHLRADQETSMDPIALAALCSAFGLRTDSLEHLRADIEALAAHKATAEAEKTRADSAEAEVATLKPIVEALGVESVAGIDSAIAERVGQVVQARNRADALGVEVPADVVSATAILEHVAKTKFPDADLTRTDAATLVFAAEALPKLTAAQKMAGTSAPRTDSGADSSTPRF